MVLAVVFVDVAVIGNGVLGAVVFVDVAGICEGVLGAVGSSKL